MFAWMALAGCDAIPYGEAFGDEAPIGLVVNGPPEPLVLVLQD